MEDNKIDLAISLCEKAQAQEKSYSYLPDIIEALKKLREIPEGNRYGTATAIGRLVLEDYAFSESSLGTILLEIADSY